MIKAIKVGILNDMSDGPPGPANIERWLRLAVDEVIAQDRLDRDVEFIHSWGLGLPTGTAAAVQHAYTELVDRDALLIVGPAIGDNALVATPLAEKYCLPTINWAGSERARSDYMFHLQVGSHEEESIVLARYLASNGVKRVGVISDRSPIGRRYKQFFEAEAEVVRLDVVAGAVISPVAEEADAKCKSLLDTGVEAIVYLGLGVAAPAVATAVAVRKWEGLRVMNSAGIRGYAPEFARVIDQWIYIDMHSDDNRTLIDLRGRFGIERQSSMGAAKGYDLGRLIAEGLARAPELTREGLKAGLEQIKWLPAAEGHEGTLLGFGNHDRGALHGRYLVLRQWRDGKTTEIPGM
jgi:ABC-type branched-subunit amino acid transport system substrate-binding protein